MRPLNSSPVPTSMPFLFDPQLRDLYIAATPSQKVWSSEALWHVLHGTPTGQPSPETEGHLQLGIEHLQWGNPVSEFCQRGGGSMCTLEVLLEKSCWMNF